MSEWLIVAGCFFAWWATGALSVAWVIYTDGSAFRRGYYQDRLDTVHAFLASMAGAGMLLYAIALRVFRAAQTARENKARLAEELEKELAAARREIDAMLKREKA